MHRSLAFRRLDEDKCADGALPPAAHRPVARSILQDANLTNLAQSPRRIVRDSRHVRRALKRLETSQRRGFRLHLAAERAFLAPRRERSLDPPRDDEPEGANQRRGA